MLFFIVPTKHLEELVRFSILGCFRAGAHMERVHMDMLDPFPPSEQGNKYILVMVDQFTKWVEIHALPDITAVQTAKYAMDQFFSRFGTPLQIHTDQGGNFDGNVMKALCHLYCIAKTQTTIDLVPMARLNGTIDFCFSSYTATAIQSSKPGIRISRS